MLRKADLSKNNTFLKKLYVASLKEKKHLLEKARSDELKTVVKIVTAVTFGDLPVSKEKSAKLEKSQKALRKFVDNPKKLLKSTTFQLRTRLISLVRLLNIFLSAIYEK